MKTFLYGVTAVVLACGINVAAQSRPLIEPTPTPVKLVITDTMPAIKPPAHVARPTPTPIIVGQSEASHGPNAAASPAPIVVGSPAASTGGTAAPLRMLSFGTIKSKIAEAKREMQSRPIATAMSESTVPTEFVRLAFLDSKTHHIDFAVMTKEAFLSTTSDKTTVSQNGKSLIVRTIRGNGVNTPISIVDSYGVAHTPLIVQYPVVRGGKYMETAYYVSTHNGIVTPEVVSAGNCTSATLSRSLATVWKKKASAFSRRSPTSPNVSQQSSTSTTCGSRTNITRRSTTTFSRFTLERGTDVSLLGQFRRCGRMVQMIPATYRMMRSRYPGVGLMPDFVEGIRDHVNATQAMLLYMQMTWNDLVASPTVGNALAANIATQEQLMAAGYNSNPAKLPGYINRGGENWTSLIPNETKMYLQIYSSLERFVPMAPRTR